MIAQTADSKVITSQWVDEGYEASKKDEEVVVSGSFRYIKFNHFTPFKMVIFRLFMIAFGWHTKLAYNIKGLIRKILIWKSTQAPITFLRKINLGDEEVVINDTLNITGDIEIQRLLIGDEFNHRYVPQSMYFQSQELNVDGLYLTEEMLKVLNDKKQLTLTRKINLSGTTNIEYK